MSLKHGECSQPVPAGEETEPAPPTKLARSDGSRESTVTIPQTLTDNFKDPVLTDENDKGARPRPSVVLGDPLGSAKEESRPTNLARSNGFRESTAVSYPKRRGTVVIQTVADTLTFPVRAVGQGFKQLMHDDVDSDDGTEAVRRRRATVADALNFPVRAVGQGFNQLRHDDDVDSDDGTAPVRRRRATVVDTLIFSIRAVGQGLNQLRHDDDVDSDDGTAPVRRRKRSIIRDSLARAPGLIASSVTNPFQSQFDHSNNQRSDDARPQLHRRSSFSKLLLVEEDPNETVWQKCENYSLVELATLLWRDGMGDVAAFVGCFLLTLSCIPRRVLSHIFNSPPFRFVRRIWQGLTAHIQTPHGFHYHWARLTGFIRAEKRKLSSGQGHQKYVYAAGGAMWAHRTVQRRERRRHKRQASRDEYD